MFELLKSWDWHKIILWGALLACIYILLTGKCNCNRPVPLQPTVKTVHDQKVILQKDEKEIKRVKDSFDLVLTNHYKDDDKDYNDYLDLLNENDRLQHDILLLSKVQPDTCKPFVDQYNKYVAQTNKTLSAANMSINGLKNTISIQKKFLTVKDSNYSTIRKYLDTCFAQQQKLQDYIDKYKVKREINISAVALGSYIAPYKLSAGIVLGYRNRKGFEINIGAYTNNTISIGIKKPLLKF